LQTTNVQLIIHRQH